MFTKGLFSDNTDKFSNTARNEHYLKYSKQNCKKLYKKLETLKSFQNTRMYSFTDGVSLGK